MRKVMQQRDRLRAAFRRRVGRVTGTMATAYESLKVAATTLMSDLYDYAQRAHTAYARGWRSASRGWRGSRHPFSSDRQHARYARQMAAGQLAMKGVPGYAD